MSTVAEQHLQSGGHAVSSAAPRPPTHVVSVRELCAFAAKSGDLDLRFTPAPTSAQGIAGHQTVARRRGATRRAEMPLQLDYGPLRVRGRADGFDATHCHLDEVKTHRGAVEHIPLNHRALHWAQAKVYGWMVCEQLALTGMRITVVYFDIDSEAETPFTEVFEAASLRAFFEGMADRYLVWATHEAHHRKTRDDWLRELAWPHPDFRAGQRDFAKGVYNAVRARRHLLAQAPTGIGKTMAALFPMLKAMPGHPDCAALDKVFFLTAKTTGRQLALDAVAALRTSGSEPVPLRVVSLIAREKACEHPDKQCHGDSCPLARGFYDRMPAARSDAAVALTGTTARVREVALRHRICPYYLAQEMTRWADVVVADYNYLFDASALLNALAVENDWKVGVLIDEGHNLVGRARDMYTADLRLERVRSAIKGAPTSVAPALKKLHRALRAVVKGQTEVYRVHDAMPDMVLDALRAVTASVGEVMAREPDVLDATLLDLYFDTLRFASLAETMDSCSQFDVTLQPMANTRSRDATLCLRNIVPARHLASRFKATQASVVFSATLSPFEYQKAMLGLPETCVELDVPSPFAADQLSVRVARDISTRYSDRDASLRRVALLIVEQWTAHRGNYLAFFSSFDYLEKVAREIGALAPDLPLHLQRRQMTECERNAFVGSFTSDSSQVGFAVLGGAFGEGLDLPGTRLVGAFIVTLGLPQVNPVNEAMRRRLHEQFGDGYGYTYLYPGMQKVVQAAGRVIRTPDDRGVLHLVDDRFQRPDVRALLPRWWRVRSESTDGEARR